MRQRLGQKKVNKYAKATGLSVIHGLTRGGTGHRVDLCLEDGSVMHYWPKTGETTKSSIGWAGGRAWDRFKKGARD